MQVTIVPASTQTGKATIKSLLQTVTESEIYAVYRNLAKVPEEFTKHANFHAIQGDITDGSSLDFTGSDAVLSALPPVYGDKDALAQAETIGQNIKSAVEQASVKRLVLLSSVGAEFEEGAGEIKTCNIAERILTASNVSEILIIRAAYFMENLTACVDSLKGSEPYFTSTITPLDYKIPMVAVQDIGINLAMALTSKYTPPKKPYVFELHGPENFSMEDCREAFTAVLGRDVKVKSIAKEDIAAHYAQIFPPQNVHLWVEMALSILPGGIMATDSPQREKLNVVRGKCTLQEAFKPKLL